MSKIICPVCFHHCHLQEGGVGLCRARANEGGQSVCVNYGRLTSLAMDPIEKKPLYRFHPGSRILSAGSYGCNLACPFCQNSSISMANEESVRWRYFPPEELARIALEEPGNLGIAFTYNEPLISYEYILDVARIIRPKGKKVVCVTNGTVTGEILELLAGDVDAMNIDLKGGEDFYKTLRGDRQSVLDAIAYLADRCHIEVTTLVIPGRNDTGGEMEEEAAWLASISPEIPLHLSRYFPRYHYTEPPTDVRSLKLLAKIARKHLHYVYLGNV